MTQHPITPPENLVASMIEQAFNPLGATGLSDQDQLTGAFTDLVTRAAQWGADQELEACCEWLRSKNILEPAIDALRTDRRPKPLSLKEQAKQALFRFDANAHMNADEMQDDFDLIRRALEQLP
jgi:hypothetical protein